jgi:threonine/homoserine/homoserine lactone efflux protein
LSYLYLFVLGAVIAFVVSIPIGAVNMAIFQTTIYHNRRAGYCIGLGAVIAELIYCAIPLLSLTVMLEETGIIDILFFVFIPILLFLGIYNIIQRKKGIETSGVDTLPRVRRSYFGYVVYGFLLCLSNPMTLFFWVNATIGLRSQEILTQDLLETIIFALGVPVGTFLLYKVFVVLADRTRSKLNPKLHERINLVIGIIFIVLSFYLLFKYLVKEGIL